MKKMMITIRTICVDRAPAHSNVKGTQIGHFGISILYGDKSQKPISRKWDIFDKLANPPIPGTPPGGTPYIKG